MLLAAEIPWSPNSQELAALLVLSGIGFLVSIAVGIVTIWDKVRRKPSLGDDLAKYQKDAVSLFATKDELALAEARIGERFSTERDASREEMRNVRAELTSLRSTVDQGMSEIRRALGRVEGKLEGKS